MNFRLVSAFVLPFLFLSNGATAQELASDIPYVENGHKRQVLDIYAPEKPAGKNLPVMFWIHGGGWQAGNKSDVALKPKALTEGGFVFVSTNYRLFAGGGGHGGADRRRRQIARLGCTGTSPGMAAIPHGSLCVDIPPALSWQR